jgi:hypothetical protein
VQPEISPGDYGGAGVTLLSVTTQRLFAHFAVSPRRSLVSRLAAILGRTDIPGRTEFEGLRPQTRFLIVCLLAWIGVVALMTVIAVASVELSTMRLPAWLGAPAAASTGAEIRSAAGFENILQRPLFLRSRQGISVNISTPPAPAAELDPNFTLKGVFINGASAKAFLMSSQNPLGMWAQIDEDVDGWRIVAIQPGQVLLASQNQRLAIPLSISGGAK